MLFDFILTLVATHHEMNNNDDVRNIYRNTPAHLQLNIDCSFKALLQAQYVVEYEAEK